MPFRGTLWKEGMEIYTNTFSTWFTTKQNKVFTDHSSRGGKAGLKLWSWWWQLFTLDKRNQIIPELTELLFHTLHFLATGSFHTGTGTWHFTGAENRAASGNQLYYIPNRSTGKKEEMKRRFCNTANFPSVLGEIGCTHIQVIAPSANKHIHRNGKHIHPLSVQLIHVVV